VAFFALISTLFTITQPKMCWTNINIILSVIYLAFMVYAVIAFVKPLPCGAFIVKVMTITALINGLISIISSIILGNYMMAIFAMLALALAVILFLFLMKDDELDFIFPKDKRKLYFGDYLFPVAQILPIISIALATNIIECPSYPSDNEFLYEKSTVASNEYSWIVGTWTCDMGAYGAVVVEFKGDGLSGDCVEAQYGSFKNGTYKVNGNTLSYKLDGESLTTTIEIESGHRLSAGGGHYYHKK